ncbi:MAG: DeoR/GlpR transcriptional regulator [Hungatella sp.]|nr:DeoR/GlpR transcriptional regulator [Hungatella sp.]
MEGRRQEMIDLVNREGEVSFNQLREHFPDVSEVTLRKDLRILDAGQHLIRIYGGAKSIRSTYTNMTSYYMRNTRQMEEKQQIARKAVKLLKPYDSLYLAAGSTCCAIAQNLPDIPLRIVTDGLETALALSKQKKAELLVLGGEMNLETMQMTGARVLAELEPLRLDYAFNGTLGYSLEYGFGYQSVHALMLTRQLKRRAAKLVIVMDSSKVESVRAMHNLEAKEVDLLISDDNLKQEAAKSLTKQHVMVL